MFNSLLVLENYVWFSKFLLKSFNNLDLGKRSLAPPSLKVGSQIILIKKYGFSPTPSLPFLKKVRKYEEKKFGLLP